MQITRSLKRAKEPDLTPLIDIVFQLVIFFMLTTSFIAAQSIELSLSEGKAATVLPGEAPVMQVQIASTGHVTVDNQAVSKNELEDHIILQLAKHPNTSIKLLSTPGVSVQQLVTVMDMVTLNGGRNVAVDRLEYADESAPLLQGDVLEGAF